MYTVVLILMLLIAFNFILKQTFWKFKIVVLSAVVAAVFVSCIWHLAIEQSKTQIADWLSDSQLMLNTSVLLTIEVALHMSYCMLAVHIGNTGIIKKRTLWTYRILRWFPGLLIYAVLFNGLVYLIFAFPGTSFSQISYVYAAVILLLIPAGQWLLKWLLPEKDLRLELLFLSNALLAILGIVATVNGRTAVNGTNSVDWFALLGIILTLLIGISIGMLIYIIKIKRIKKQNQLN